MADEINIRTAKTKVYKVTKADQRDKLSFDPSFFQNFSFHSLNDAFICERFRMEQNKEVRRRKLCIPSESYFPWNLDITKD